MENKLVSSYKSGTKSVEFVRQQLLEKYGKEISESYDPRFHVFTMKDLNQAGYRVRKGEKALKSFVVREVAGEEGKAARRYVKPVNLFHLAMQCEKIN